MKEDVKICVAARVDFFGTYYDVPPTAEEEVSALIAEIQALGAASADAQEFEAQFVATGLSDKFNATLPKCTPKTVPMTEEQKAYTKQVKKEMWEEQKGQIAKDVLEDVTDSLLMKAESDARQARRVAMSEAGVLDDYTRASNAVENAQAAGKFLSKLFKKK